jgi:hypothetical protein
VLRLPNLLIILILKPHIKDVQIECRAQYFYIISTYVVVYRNLLIWSDHSLWEVFAELWDGLWNISEVVRVVTSAQHGAWVAFVLCSVALGRGFIAATVKLPATAVSVLNWTGYIMTWLAPGRMCLLLCSLEPWALCVSTHWPCVLTAVWGSSVLCVSRQYLLA